jgi:hypothetical protein
MQADWLLIWREAVLAGVGHGAEVSARVQAALADAELEDVRPVADRALALFRAGHISVRPVIPIACYGALLHRSGLPFPARFHRLLMEHAPNLRFTNLLPVAGEALRGCPPDQVDEALSHPFLHAELLGHVGGAARAERLVTEIRSWSRDVFTRTRKQAYANDLALDFRVTYGDTAREFTQSWIDGLVACGADAVAPIQAALSAGTAHDRLLKKALDGIAEATQPGSDAADDVRRLLDSEGRAWRHLTGSPEANLRTVNAWYAAHIAGSDWYARRPAYGEALVAHADLPQVAVEVLTQINRSGAGALHTLVAAYGTNAVHPLVFEQLTASAQQPKVAEEVLWALATSKVAVPARVAVGPAGTATAAARDHILRLLLSTTEPAADVDAVLADALAATLPATRSLAARAAELRGHDTILPALRAAARKEKRGPVRAEMKRAAAALSGDPVEKALATLDDPLPKHVPRPDSLPTLTWQDGTEVTLSGRHGLLAALLGEDQTGPSPLAHRAARRLDPAAAQSWARALFIERPKLNTKSDAFRCYSSLVLLDDEHLLAFCNRLRRRMAHPLLKEMPGLLARRDTPGAREAQKLVG